MALLTSRTTRIGRKILDVITNTATDVAAIGIGRFCDPMFTQLVTETLVWGVGIESVHEDVYSLPDEDNNECVQLIMSYTLWTRGRASNPIGLDVMQETCFAAVDKMKDCLRFNPTLDGMICRSHFGDEKMNPFSVQLDPLEVTCMCPVICRCSIKEPYPGDYYCEPLE